MLLLTCELDKPVVVIIKFLKLLLQVIQIAVPIGLIVLGTLDLGRAVISSDEKAIKKAQSTLVRRFMAATITFLVMLIATFALGFFGSTEWKECWNNPVEKP